MSEGGAQGGPAGQGRGPGSGIGSRQTVMRLRGLRLVPGRLLAMSKAAHGEPAIFRRASALVLALVATGIYVSAFALPAVDWGGGHYFLSGRLNGFEAFESGWHFPPLWPANPCAWLGLA